MNRVDYPLLAKQLAALERVNLADEGGEPTRRDGDFELLVGLENMLSEMIGEHERPKMRRKLIIGTTPGELPHWELQPSKQFPTATRKVTP